MNALKFTKHAQEFRMHSDPFSDFLRLADAKPVVAGGFSAGGDWAIRFPKPEYLKFFALVKGRCVLMFEGERTPIYVEEGDVFLLSSTPSFVLASDCITEPVDAKALFSGSHNKTAVIGDGKDCIQLGGHVKLDPDSGKLLAQVLPSLIHVRASSQQAGVLSWLLEQLVREVSQPLPGFSVVSMQLTQLMFVQILREYLQTTTDLPCNWLKAVSDKRLQPALALMHNDPAQNWQLSELAKAAAMSRTSFAVYFKSIAGVAPLTYLTQWRMYLAGQSLRQSELSVSTLALQYGYASESAFSTAFKRINGVSPRNYRNLKMAELADN